jgi:uncharacterized protein (DUF433 family)
MADHHWLRGTQGEDSLEVVELRAKSPKSGTLRWFMMTHHMTHNELLQRISMDPNICGGRPCVRGHRIWASLILDYLASGMSEEEVLGEYPQLVREDMQACLAYGSELARERTVHVA